MNYSKLPDLHTLILNSSQKLPIAFMGEKEKQIPMWVFAAVFTTDGIILRN